MGVSAHAVWLIGNAEHSFFYPWFSREINWLSGVENADF